MGGFVRQMFVSLGMLLAIHVAKATTKNVLPLKVLKLTNEGWPNKLGSADLDFVPFFLKSQNCMSCRRLCCRVIV